MAPKIGWLVIAVMLLLPSPVWSDTVGELNTAVSGDTARAADVNENFTAVKAAVDGNDALIAALEARIEALEAQAPVPGPEGPQGEPGEDGLDGAPGPQGEPGPEGPSLRVFDALGTEIGLYMGGTALLLVYEETLGVILRFYAPDAVLSLPSSQIGFSDSGCVGDAWGPEAGTPGLLFYALEEDPGGPRFFYILPNELKQVVTTPSGARSAPWCEESPRTGPVLPAIEVLAEELAFLDDLVAPLYVGLAPEAGP